MGVCGSFSKPDNYYGSSKEVMLQYIPATVKRTLEFGCGCGFFSEMVKKQFNAECWAVEINERAAQIASGKLYKVIRSDANDSLAMLPDNYFDCIILNDVLEHLADPFYLLENMKAKLNSGGVAVLSIPNVRFWNHLRAFVWQGEWDYQEAGILDNTHLRFFTYKSLVKLFGGSGYEILTIEGLNPTHNTKFRVLNFLLLNRLWDARYHHFACVIKPVNRNSTKCEQK
jgi:2-polyprenyl-3-methyl-5-hydroxy-6-metoxy-1,4-benzoquinol methylase